VLNDAGNDGLLFGNPGQFVTQGIAVLASGLYAAVLTFGILKLIDATIGLRVVDNDEREGLDSALHGEQGYAAGMGGGGHDVEATGHLPAVKEAVTT
jgi:Amt family ammonium transporter